MREEVNFAVMKGLIDLVKGCEIWNGSGAKFIATFRSGPLLLSLPVSDAYPQNDGFGSSRQSMSGEGGGSLGQHNAAGNSAALNSSPKWPT